MLDFLEEKFTKLVSDFKNVLKELFVPSESYFDGKIDEIKTKFESKFPIVDQLLTLFNDLINSTTVTTAELPLFEFEIYGVQVALIDFTLLEEYLPMGRNVISMFLWLQFLTSLLFKLPNLIQGQTFFEVRGAELDHNFAYLQRRSHGKFRRL